MASLSPITREPRRPSPPSVPFDEAVSVRLDETADEAALTRDGAALRFPVPAHGLRSVHLR